MFLIKIFLMEKDILVQEIKSKFKSFDYELTHLYKISLYSLIVNLKKIDKVYSIKEDDTMNEIAPLDSEILNIYFGNVNASMSKLYNITKNHILVEEDDHTITSENGGLSVQSDSRYSV